VRTVFAMDPAARSLLEVLTCYPGLHALWCYRFAHWLWTHHLRLFGRLLSHFGRFVTGIEIHPGAKIGRRFFVDHGMGVVIGETAEVGNDVLIYQGVVLGGTSLKKEKRHPTIGNSVVIGTAAILLGPITMGDGSRVGANSVVVKSVPPGATVVGVPGHLVEEKREPVADLEHGRLPDPVSERMRSMAEQQRLMEDRIKRLEEKMGTPAPQGESEERQR
jgi:serine O-acetyltransferase